MLTGQNLGRGMLWMFKSGAVAFRSSQEWQVGVIWSRALEMDQVLQYPSLSLLDWDSFVVLSCYPLILKIAKDEHLQSQAINANKSIQRPWAQAVFDCGLALLKDDYTCWDASPFKPQCPQDPRPRSLPLSTVILLTQQTRPYGVSLAAPSAEDSWVTRIAVDRGSGSAQGTSPFKR